MTIAAEIGLVLRMIKQLETALLGDTTNRPNGKELNEKWKVGARHALYSENGKWYHHLNRFPGALFDFYGYIVFATREEYEACEQLNHGNLLHVIGNGISSIPGYVRMGPAR